LEYVFEKRDSCIRVGPRKTDHQESRVRPFRETGIRLREQVARLAMGSPEARFAAKRGRSLAGQSRQGMIASAWGTKKGTVSLKAEYIPDSIYSRFEMDDK
jgi:hypothetical protein